jgi:RNA polymerase sigma-70 factor (ECF subfamily)
MDLMTREESSLRPVPAHGAMMPALGQKRLVLLAPLPKPAGTQAQESVAPASSRFSKSKFQAALRRREDEFNLLYQAHRRMVMGLIMKILRDPDAAADVAQETWLLVWRKLHQLQERAHVRTWLGRIALNRAYYRRRETQFARAALTASVDELRALGWDPRDERPGPLEQAILAERDTRVRERVLGLTPCRREAIVGYYWEELSYPELAARHALTPMALKSRAFQGKRALRQFLKDAV